MEEQPEPRDTKQEAAVRDELADIREASERDDVAKVDALEADDGRLRPAVDRHGNPITLRYSEALALERANGVVSTSYDGDPTITAELARDLVDVVERIGRFREGPIARVVDETGEREVEGETALAPISLETLRDAIVGELNAAVAERVSQGRLARSSGVGDVVEIGRLAAAARDVDEILRGIPEDGEAAKPAPPFDVDELIGRVWNAANDAGAPTVACDAAVDEIRKAAA